MTQGPVAPYERRPAAEPNQALQREVIQLTRRPSLFLLGAVTLVAVLALGAIATTAVVQNDRARETPTQPATAFPRTATYFLDQHNLPSIAELARYDLVVIQSEWQHRVDRRWFTELRAANPDVTVLAYVDLVDKLPRTGARDWWANNYSLWQFQGPTHDTFPAAWLARTAAGEPVHEWLDYPMTNLTDQAPRVGGLQFNEYAANWVVDEVWSTGLWDGIFLDVWGEYIYTADHDAWDIDGDGQDETYAEIYGPGGPLDRGLTNAERIMRQRMPSAILIANGNRTVRDGLLNGVVFEEFADPRRGPDLSVPGEWERYIRSQSGGEFATPAVSMTTNTRRDPHPNSDELRLARLLLTATLMQNAWWTPMGADQHYGTTAYYDELDGGGLGRGYLGAPVEPSPDLAALSAHRTDGTGSPADRVFRRDFENGIVLVNLSDEPHTIRLERDYRRLRGDQAPAVNDGAVVDQITLPPKDGRILLRR